MKANNDSNLEDESSKVNNNNNLDGKTSKVSITSRTCLIRNKGQYKSDRDNRDYPLNTNAIAVSMQEATWPKFINDNSRLCDKHKTIDIKRGCGEIAYDLIMPKAFSMVPR